jgi:hypothetical protein
MCKTWYNSNPDPIRTHGQVWICCDHEMVEQAHVGHGLQQLDTASVDVYTSRLLTNMPGVDRRFAIS